MQIDELLIKLNNASGDLERLRDEKDQEIMILQAGMDSTIEQLSEAQQVRETRILLPISSNYLPESRIGRRDNQCPNRHSYPRQSQEA